MRNILTAVLIVAALSLLFSQSQTLAGQGGTGAQTCSINNITAPVVGHQESKTILPSAPNRAWARIQLSDNATNTVAISLGSTTAAFARGLVLSGAVTGGATSTVDYFDLGLNTDLPYTGAVYALTDNGSTTLRITDCLY